METVDVKGLTYMYGSLRAPQPSSLRASTATLTITICWKNNNTVFIALLHAKHDTGLAVQ